MDHTYQRKQFNSGLFSPAGQIVQSRFMNRTYGWMVFGLILTAAMSLAIAASETAIQFIFANQWVFYGVMITELVVVFGLSAAHKRLSATTATLGFLFYSVLNGVTFSVIFLAYQLAQLVRFFYWQQGCLADWLSMDR